MAEYKPACAQRARHAVVAAAVVGGVTFAGGVMVTMAAVQASSHRGTALALQGGCVRV